MLGEDFELKVEHIKLLREANINWDDCEFGAPCIDPKRPFGNSDVYGDIVNILGMPKVDDRNYEKVQEQLYLLHKDLETALEIILHNQTFKPGIYYKKDKYSDEWTFKGEKR